MNLLFLAHEPPYPPNDGGRIRNYHILKRVAARHATTLVTFAEDAEAAASVDLLRGLCRQVVAVALPPRLARTPWHKFRDLGRCKPISLERFGSHEMQATLAELTRAQPFDVVHVNHLLVAGYVTHLNRRPAVLCHENVEAEAQRRQRALEYRPASLRWRLSWLEQRRWRRFEINVSRRYDALTAVSERDAQYFRRHLPRMPVVVVPNGVDVAVFRPFARDPGAPRSEPVVLYTGSMDYPPNVDAVTWFAQAIWPTIHRQLPAARFLAVGRNPGSEVQSLAGIPGISVTGTVPDVRPYFEQASVYVVPLRSGSGTRLKILEAMAMGMPIVSTVLGAEGLNVTPAVDLVIADEPSQFASEVLRLLANRDAQVRLGLQARQTAERCYSWNAVVEEQERAYELAMAKRR